MAAVDDYFAGLDAPARAAFEQVRALAEEQAPDVEQGTSYGMAYGDGLADRVRATAPQGVDAVYDAAGQGALEVSIELRGGTDRIVTIADPRAAELGVTFSGAGRPFGTELAGYALLAVEGRLGVRVAQSLPLADAGKAHGLSATGSPGGKLVLRP